MVKPLVLLEEKVAVVILNHKFCASRLRSHYYYHRDDQGGGFLPYPEYVEICPGVAGWRVAIGSGCESLKKTMLPYHMTLSNAFLHVLIQMKM